MFLVDQKQIFRIANEAHCDSLDNLLAKHYQYILEVFG